MPKELFLMAEKIKSLREQTGMTQSELARKIGLTRSSVNAWEMGLSVPSTPYVVELAKIFHVSTDYLLGMGTGEALNIDDLNEKEVAALLAVIQCLKSKRER